MIARQTAFYQRQRDLLRAGRYVGSEPLAAQTPDLSLAAWWCDQPPTLRLHVINRRVGRSRPCESLQLQPQREVLVRIPGVLHVPQSVAVVSPDWDGPQPATCRAVAGGLEVAVSRVEASAIAPLRWPPGDSPPIDFPRLADPVRIVPVALWSRPAGNEFPVQGDASVRPEEQLNGFLQGRLHTHLRNPPTFLVHARTPGRLLVKIGAVATAGARLVAYVDERETQVVELPDRDGRNDGSAAEYEQVFEVPFPAGRHRLRLDNTGGDWLTVRWYQFTGSFADWD